MIHNMETKAGKMKQNKNIKSVQFLRGIAAVMVVLIHAFQFIPAHELNNFPPNRFPSFLIAGGAGVDIFFVISGFLMCYILSNKDLTPSRFILARTIRVVPIYWFWSLMFFLYVFIRWSPAFLAHEWIPHLAKSLLFINAAGPDGITQPFLNVGWTLNYEFIFYVFVFFIALHFKYKNITTQTLTLTYSLSIALLIYFEIYSPQLLEFFLGIAVFYIWKKTTINQTCGYIFIIFSFLTIIIAAKYAHEAGGFARLFIWGTPSALLLLGFLSVDNHINWDKYPFFIMLGDASYSIYLTHWFFRFDAYRTLPFITQNITIQFLICVTLMVSLGIACFRYIEQPLLSWINNKINKNLPTTR
ncbi:hypothetical protein B0T40_24810 [Chromobacterium haemolyticum]|nr:hypothetical protein B0T40_24810 [Chromobacterium haemolyticum]